jgi:hypothetical protein
MQSFSAIPAGSLFNSGSGHRIAATVFSVSSFDFFQLIAVQLQG